LAYRARDYTHLTLAIALVARQGNKLACQAMRPGKAPARRRQPCPVTLREYSAAHKPFLQAGRVADSYRKSIRGRAGLSAECREIAK
jgi:hypothetical protein